MKPKKLVLLNIGPFVGKHEVDFSNFESMFLVWGNTGSGKTTIFDAISYAFYGKAPGGREAVPKNMRSHFAPVEETSEVELIFSIANMQYKILRRLPYTDAKGKDRPDEVELWKYDSETTGWVNISESKKSDTKSKIQNLIKLNFEEFSRIVLLPQGEFADFLSKNSTERQKILENLFPVSNYSAIMAKAKDLAKSLSEKAKTFEEQLETLKQTYNEYSYESTYNDLNKIIERLKQELKENTRKMDSAKEERIQAKLVIEQKERFDELNEQLELCKNNEPVFEKKKVRIEKARSALPLSLQVRQIDELTDSYTEKNAELETLKTNLEKAVETLELYKNEKNKIAEEKKYYDELRNKKDRLMHASTVFNEINETDELLKSVKKEIKPKQTELDESLKKIETVKSELQKLQQDVDLLGERNEKVDKHKSELSYLSTLLDLVKKYDEKNCSFKTHKATAEKKEIALSEIIQNIKIEEKENTGLKELKQKIEHSESAFTLAQTLEENKPCPVCGSVHHPTIAEQIAPLDFSIDDRIKKSDSALANFENQKLQLEKELSERKTSTQHLSNELKEIEKSFSDLNNANVKLDIIINSLSEKTIDDIQQLHKNTIDILNESVELSSASSQALERKKDLELKRDKMQSVHEKLNSEINSLKEKETTLLAGLNEKKKLFKDLVKDIKNDADIQDPNEALEKCENEITELSLKINSFDEKFSEAEKKVDRLMAEKQINFENLNDIKRQITEKTDAVEIDCVSAGFANFDELRDALMPKSEIEKQEKEIKNFNETKAALVRQVTVLEKDLKNYPEYNLEEIENKISALEKDAEALEAHSANETTKLMELNNKHERYTELFNEHKKASEEAETVKRLSEKLNGSNPKSLKFDTWALSYFLKQITLCANKRLERMSEGRYRLVATHEGETQKGFAGLNLQIADANTGKLRSTSTLSGGETFMASISLALGFADNITANAGGIILESMFIDEGFGSLDANYLENAISILDEVRSGRLVGIISHVSELKTRIPEKIEVEKTNYGSRIIQQ